MSPRSKPAPLRCTFEVSKLPGYPETHRRVQVTTPAGHVFACDWAGTDDQTTLALARHAWRTARKAFRPYDTTTGRYLK